MGSALAAAIVLPLVIAAIVAGVLLLRQQLAVEEMVQSSKARVAYAAELVDPTTLKARDTGVVILVTPDGKLKLRRVSPGETLKLPGWSEGWIAAGPSAQPLQTLTPPTQAGPAGPPPLLLKVVDDLGLLEKYNGKSCKLLFSGNLRDYLEERYKFKIHYVRAHVYNSTWDWNDRTNEWYYYYYYELDVSLEASGVRVRLYAKYLQNGALMVNLTIGNATMVENVTGRTVRKYGGIVVEYEPQHGIDFPSSSSTVYFYYPRVRIYTPIASVAVDTVDYNCGRILPCIAYAVNLTVVVRPARGATILVIPREDNYTPAILDTDGGGNHDYIRMQLSSAKYPYGGMCFGEVVSKTYGTCYAASATFSIYYGKRYGASWSASLDLNLADLYVYECS